MTIYAKDGREFDSKKAILYRNEFGKAVLIEPRVKKFKDGRIYETVDCSRDETRKLPLRQTDIRAAEWKRVAYVQGLYL